MEHNIFSPFHSFEFKRKDVHSLADPSTTMMVRVIYLCLVFFDRNSGASSTWRHHFQMLLEFIFICQQVAAKQTSMGLAATNITPANDT
jgi:hypothetical protein